MRLLIASGLAARCLRVLLEPAEQTVDAALRTIAAMEKHLMIIDRPVLLHGQGPTAWPLFDEAIRRGLDARVGLEDMLDLPDGSPAESNDQIVRAALARAGSA